METVRNFLIKEIAKLLADKFHGTRLDVGDFFEIPRDEKFGDLSVNVAMRLAKELKKSPRAVAEEFLGPLQESLSGGALEGRVSKVSVEGAGFINFTYSQKELVSFIDQIEGEKDVFGKPEIPRKKNILLEFVSANPTGPLTIAHGRQAALGDSLARILRFCGHRVTTEYYNNDEGVQINTLAASLKLRVTQKVTGKELEA